MKRILLKYLVIIVSIYGLSMIVDSIRVDNVISLMFLGCSVLLVNMIIKPVLHLLALPFTVITFGLFAFVVNAWALMLADFFVPGIELGSFWNALISALVITVANHFLISITKKES